MFHVKHRSILPPDIQARLSEVDKARRTGRAAAAPKIEDMPELACIGRDRRLDGAACAGYPLPLWDESVHGESAGARDERHRVAALICERCPVRAACAAIAASLPPSSRCGVWAGQLQHPEHLEDEQQGMTV